ncbi:hypothetical protein [Formosa sp. A9]|uniref:hypothetical protein n=1 Tax=Formosa sp. A9 TaxID=3442641 RepID=UPI003EB8888A
MLFVSNIAGLHALTHVFEDGHDENDNNLIECVICDLALTQQSTPSLKPNFDDLEIKTSIANYSEKNPISFYQTMRLNTQIKDVHFGRPPPHC